jgi:hypothetical protein
VAISNPEAGFRVHFNREDCKAVEFDVVVAAVGFSSAFGKESSTQGSTNWIRYWGTGNEQNNEM